MLHQSRVEFLKENTNRVRNNRTVSLSMEDHLRKKKTTTGYSVMEKC